MSYYNREAINVLVGVTLESVETLREQIIFHVNDGSAFTSLHLHDCCETVQIHHIEGDIASILNVPVLEAEETHSNDPALEGPYNDSWTWTRQRIRTERGEVTFVWLGESNGYYGETPYFQRTHGKKV